MAIAFDTSNGAAGTADSTTFVVTITAAATGADVFLWAAWGVSAGTFSQTGWTQIATLATDSTMTVGLFHRKKIVGDTTFTFTTQSGKGCHAWASYTGLHATTPYQTAGAANLLKKNTAGTNIPTATVTNTTATSWALAFHASRSSTSANKVITFTPAATLTERRDQNNSAATASIWTGGEIADSAGAVTAASHSYTAVASFSETHGAGGLLYLNVAASGSNVTGTAAASPTFTATEVGKRTVKALVAPSPAFSASVTGRRTVKGVAAPAPVFVATVLGQRVVKGILAPSPTFTATVLGQRAVKGVLAPSPTFTATALGVVTGAGPQTVLGVAAGSLAFAAVVGGLRTITGQTAGSGALTAVVVGKRIVTGTTVVPFTSTAVVAGKRSVKGLTATTITLLAVAAAAEGRASYLGNAYGHVADQPGAGAHTTTSTTGRSSTAGSEPGAITRTTVSLVGGAT